MKAPRSSIQPSTRRMSTRLDTPEWMRALASLAGMSNALMPAETRMLALKNLSYPIPTSMG